MVEMVFEIRKARTGDIKEIQLLAKKSFEMYTKNAGITKLIAPLEETYDDILKAIETTNVFVAIAGQEVIGSVRIEIKPDKTAYLSRFGVSSVYQNNGIGKILLNAVDKSMKELGVSYLYLHTASKVLSLIRFYYGRGFCIESTNNDLGYDRALLCKNYETAKAANPLDNIINI